MEHIDTNSLRNLTNAELQRAFEVCGQLHRVDNNASFLHHSFSPLNSAIGHVHLSPELYRLEPFTLAEVENPTVDPSMIKLFDHLKLDHPYAQRMLSSAPRHLETLQREPCMKAFKRSALYNEFYDKVQGQNQLWIAFRDNNELLSCVYLRETEYTESELAMMRLIQPHLETAWKNWKRTRKLKQELGMLKEAIFQSEEEEAAATELRQTLNALPVRQQDVIELVAAGMDNQQIADALKISVLTVKKHLQAIFRTMDIHHRTELAAKWHQAHSISIY